MIYACDTCHFLFERVGETAQCPDCGKDNIRAANDTEIEEFLNRRPDEELSKRNDNNE